VQIVKEARNRGVGTAWHRKEKRDRYEEQKSGLGTEEKDLLHLSKALGGTLWRSLGAEELCALRTKRRNATDRQATRENPIHRILGTEERKDPTQTKKFHKSNWQSYSGVRIPKVWGAMSDQKKERKKIIRKTHKMRHTGRREKGSSREP